VNRRVSHVAQAPRWYPMNDPATLMVSGKNRPPAGGSDAPKDERIEVIGRYSLHLKIGVGGMATVCLGWVSGAADFSRVVAIKRMHPQFSLNEQFAARFRDEAWLSSRLLHPNIVQVLDVVEQSQELLIVMEYVHGVSLAGILKDASAAGRKVPPNVVAGILVPALHGLHAAHEAIDDDGHAIGIVHRDFSPQNIMVSSEGQSKILDFGIAKAKTHVHVTSSGRVSGKFAYISPEQALAGAMDRRTDVFAAGIVLWEMLACERLFGAPELTDAAVLHRVLTHPIRRPSSVNSAIPNEVDDLVLHALDRAPDQRFASARAFALALEAAIDVASPSTVAAWIETTCAKRLAGLSHTLNRTRQRMRQEHFGEATEPPSKPAIGERSIPKFQGTRAVTGQRQLGRSRARTTWTTLVAVAAALVAFTLLASFRGLLFRPWRTISPTPPTASPASPPVAPAVAPAVLPAKEVPMATEVPSAPMAAPSATSSKSPPHPTNVHPGRPRPPTTTQHPRPVPAFPKVPNPLKCDPPTYLDADGIRIFKEECL